MSLALASYFVSLALTFALVGFVKWKGTAALCEERGYICRPLVRLDAPARAVFLFLGVLTEEVCFQLGFKGAALVACAVGAAAAVELPAVRSCATRRGGRWLSLRPVDALADAPLAGSLLDGRTWRGLLVFLVAAGAVVVLFAGQISVAAIGLALVPLGIPFFSGSPVPPDERSFLRRTFVLLRAREMRVTPLARFADGQAESEETRLLVLPRDAISGVAGIEVAIGWVATASGWAPSPELLVRVQDGTCAGTKLAKSYPSAQLTQGRKPEERVLRIVVEEATPRSCASSLASLVDVLRERRQNMAPISSSIVERRAYSEPGVASAA